MERVSNHLKLYRSGADAYDDYAGRFPNLVQFLGGCFHQDWRDEHGADWRPAIRGFAASVTRDETQAIRQEIDLLLTEIERKKHEDAEVVRVLYHGFGCEYFPPVGASCGWLSTVSEMIRGAPAAPPTPRAGSTHSTSAAAAPTLTPRRAHSSAARNNEDGITVGSVLILLAQALAVLAAFALGVLLLG
jgi:hypothetical protein